jgi:hypothetical protein
MVGRDKKAVYFYTTSGQFTAYVGNMPRESLNGELPYVELDLNLHSANEHFPPPTPGSCVVQENDSFASISARVYEGDASFGSLIADENGYSPEDTPRAGLSLRIPNLVHTNLHNWDGLYPSYNPAAIIGSLYPNMPIPQRAPVTIDASPQRRSHKKFWHILVEALAGAAMMAFAPELAGAFAGMFGELIGQVLGQGLGYALAGGATSYAQQEMAIGFGDQSKMSMKSVGQSALLSMGTAGIAKGLGLDLAKTPQYRSFLKDAVKNVELTLATQGLSFATGQQRHFDWRIMLASIINTLANVGAKQMNLGAPVFNDAVATASASIASISMDKMLGNEMNMEAIVATTLGTFIGNQLAAQTKQHAAEYQSKKERTTQHPISQIPEIQQELAQSEQSFLHAIKHHPHQLGNISSEPTPQHHTQARKAHPTSQQRPDNDSVHQQPKQPHLLVERAREEELLTKSTHKANAHSRTQVQKPHPPQSQHKIMDMLRKANNSRIVHQINEVGDNVAHTILDMVNPVKIAKTAWADAHESVEAYRTGHILKGMALTGLTSLDVLPFVPAGGLAVNGVKYGAKGLGAAGSRLGFFGSKTTAVETIVQSVPIKHPLAGLSEENVVRLANELGLETPKDQLILWSGLGREGQGIKLSQQYATKHGRITLEMTPGGAWLHEMDLFAGNSPFNRDQATNIWRDVSRSYTQQASGQARSVLGQVRPSSIYQSQELQELRMNPRILGIEELYLKPKFETILR